MKNVTIQMFLSILLTVMMGCSKGYTSTSSNTQLTPANLVITANVSTDGSGNVAFAATADNTVSYGFEFGNGDVKTTLSGAINYQYTLAGTTTYTVTVTATGSTGLTIKKSVPVTVTVNGSTTTNGTLVFSDEFDTPGAPDPAKWGFDIGTGSNGWGNGELEYYTSRSSNAVVSNGTLKITALKENYNGSAYTSARMLTNNKFSFKYGRIEVSAKLPAGLGTWPAIWMLGSNFATASWPSCGEMDIMEQKGSELNKIYSTFHYPGNSGANGKGSTMVIQNASTAFHVYSAEWSATTITMKVDGQTIYTLPNNASLPFNQNFFVILNFAMGGAFGGSVDPAFTSATMEVDYVRVYQ